jgi:phosphoribosylglycinamide formyltransferase-1
MLAILGSGGGTTAARVIDAVRDGTIAANVAIVIGNNSTAGIFDVARTGGIRTVHLSGKTHPDPDELDMALLGVLEDSGVELLVLAGYMKKLGPRVLGRFTGSILNTHPALLPAYGGQGMYGDRVHAAVLADSQRTTGATVHQVTAGYDEGPIVAQVEVPVLADDDVPTLRDRVQEAEKGLLINVIRRWFDSPPEAGTDPRRAVHEIAERPV